MTELCKGSDTGGPDAPNGVATLVAVIPRGPTRNSVRIGVSCWRSAATSVVTGC